MIRDPAALRRIHEIGNPRFNRQRFPNTLSFQPNLSSKLSVVARVLPAKVACGVLFEESETRWRKGLWNGFAIFQTDSSALFFARDRPSGRVGDGRGESAW
jgi:hypothetical protein